MSGARKQVKERLEEEKIRLQRQENAKNSRNYRLRQKELKNNVFVYFF
jgi:hypothetical protein